MAMSDEDFSPSEWKMLYQFGREREIDKDALDYILLNSTGSVEVPTEISTKIEYLYDLARMIWADEQVNEDEISMLKKYCRRFQFLEENIQELTNYLLESAKSNKSKEDLLTELL